MQGYFFIQHKGIHGKYASTKAQIETSLNIEANTLVVGDDAARSTDKGGNVIR